MPNKEEIEYYHDMGFMPDWAYYQQNGKTADENYIDIRRRNQKQLYDLLHSEDQDPIEVVITSEVKK